MKKPLLLKLFALVAAMMCALGARAQEAYACYTSADSTLTFYYDTQRSSREGITYPLNQGTQDPGWVRNGTSQFSRVVFSPSFAAARPTTTCRWFSGMGNLKTIIGMNYLNTSEVIYMIRMFSECSSLKSLNVSNFNTAKATHMHYMFNKCSSLESLDVSGWNTANVTTMSYMFNNCGGLTSLNVSGWNTANVTDMECMFSDCGGLTSLDLSGWNTSNVTDMMYLFQNCSQLATIFASSQWSTESLINSGNVWLFYGCTSLVGGQGTTFHPNKVNADYAHIDGGPSNPGYFTAEGAQPWTPPEAYAVYTPSDLKLTFYYDNLSSTRPGTIYSLNTDSNDPGWYTDGTYSSVTHVVFNSSFANARPTSAYDWFCEMSNLQTITGISYLNTSEVTNMSGMFYNCGGLTSLDLSGFNTANVADMSCMFHRCRGLTSLDLSSFNTSKVTDISHMFYNCVGLTSLDLSSFNTSEVTDMQYMFYDCYSLTSLDLSSFNTSNVTYMRCMFLDCSDLVTIYVGSQWSTVAVQTSDFMFNGCTALVGGKGTTYHPDHVDAAYAHIDGGPSNPGYFTDISPSVVTDGFLVLPDITAAAGSTVTIPIGINDVYDSDYASIQLCFFCPAEFEVVGCEKGELLDDDTQTQLLSSSRVVDGRIRYMMIVMNFMTGNNNPLVLGDEGTILYVTVKVPADASGEYAISLEEASFAIVGAGYAKYPDNVTATLTIGGTSSTRGDVDGDSNVNIDDVTALIDYLLGTNSNINLQGADCDESGDISIDDVTTLIDYLLTGLWL